MGVQWESNGTGSPAISCQNGQSNLSPIQSQSHWTPSRFPVQSQSPLGVQDYHLYHCASAAALLASASEHKSSSLVSSALWRFRSGVRTPEGIPCTFSGDFDLDWVILLSVTCANSLGRFSSAFTHSAVSRSRTASLLATSASTATSTAFNIWCTKF